MRTAQMKAIADIVVGYQKQYGANVPVVVGGDFNNDVRMCPEVEPIRAIMMDPFDVKGIRGLPRMTHTFHPRGGRSSFHQLDALFVTPGLQDNVVSIETYRYKDADGNELPLPQTFNERARNPSDHFPLTLTLSTEDVFPEAFRRAN
jgi:endonuclease/exonuclease/phosphatase family metal-dependent hydrolase